LDANLGASLSLRSPRDYNLMFDAAPPLRWGVAASYNGMPGLPLTY
jgi:hypothetical protein